MFANQQIFDNPQSRLQAMGADTRAEKAVVNAQGKPMFYPKTGGMLNPMRYAINQGELLYRFVASGTPANYAVTGGWWVDKAGFEKLTAFAQQQNTNVAMAARMLCCVPPEWSDMGMLVRARVKLPILAYRGLGKDVDIKHPDGMANVKMTAHNNIAARRFHQLYIPGLYQATALNPADVMPGALVLERTWNIDTSAAKKGWLYV